MRGHENIIKARMAGKKPPFIFLNDYPCQTDWFEFGEHATVCTHGDSIQSLDMRFVVGAAVSVSATQENRAKALSNACKQYGAHVVAACHVVSGIHPQNQMGWTEIWRAP
jgi:hypothetical protein